MLNSIQLRHNAAVDPASPRPLRPKFPCARLIPDCVRTRMKMQRLWCTLFSSFFTVLVQNGLAGSNQCNNDLGLEHLKIRDSSLTASSHSSYESLSHGECKAVGGYPSCARLNNNVCSWCVKGVGEQYLEVDFGNCTTVSGIETQGAEGCTKDYYVRKYKVSYKRDGQTWLFYPLVIKGNHNGNSRERYKFNLPLYARYIRIHPTAYRNMICLRMELYGCPNSCSSLRTTPSAKIEVVLIVELLKMFHQQLERLQEEQIIQNLEMSLEQQLHQAQRREQ
ncbi:lactadherin-like [Acropora millepora]|uniref:lactadherin-like n=1 Tax=Acropora millepora TaxID=45264 RepID=UPI001CF47943|nr:lactadherin-like [Acropora millepora]